MSKLTTTQVETLHAQVLTILNAETDADTSQTRIQALVFGSQNGQAYVRYLQEVREILEWCEGYAARHEPYQQHSTGYTTGGG